MITKCKIEKSPSLFVPNRTIHLATPPGSTAFAELAGLTFVCEVDEPSSHRSAKKAAVQGAMSLIASGLPSYSFFLHVVQSPWQPNTRVVRHGRLWRTLERQGIVIPDESRLSEELIEADEGIKFAGTLRVDPSNLDTVLDVVRAEPASLLVALPDGPPLGLDVLSAAGFSSEARDATYWREVATAVTARPGVVFRIFGEFDDRDAGVDLLLRPRAFFLLAGLARKTRTDLFPVMPPESDEK
jgi:hypothetical protein